MVTGFNWIGDGMQDSRQYALYTPLPTSMLPHRDSIRPFRAWGWLKLTSPNWDRRSRLDHGQLGSWWSVIDKLETIQPERRNRMFCMPLKRRDTMKPDDSQTRNNTELASSQGRLLREAETGRLDNLECPKCLQATLSVWFTHPSGDAYRTWVICGNCDFRFRAQNAGRPIHFSENRRRKDLEEADLSNMKQSVFKRP